MKVYSSKALRFLLILAALVAMGTCAKDEDSQDSIESVVDEKTTAVEGNVLYGQYCEACHYELKYTEMRNRTALKIQKAIEEDRGDESRGYMGPLLGLIDDENPPGRVMNSISLALVDENAGTGAPLYEAECSGCHDSLEDSQKKNKTVAEIQNSIDNDDGGEMGALILTAEQIAAISDALQGVPLYSDNCSSCHDSLSESRVQGMPSGRVRRAIDDNLGSMGSDDLKSLTPSAIHKISVALGGD